MPVSVRYQFRQIFSVSAKDAFAWCTDFNPDDHALMGYADAKRKITHIADGSVLLKDTVQTPSGNAEKQKLVALYPNLLRWTSTHLSGPNRHSQFIYAITSLGKDASELEFTALHIEHGEVADLDAFAERLCREDAATWVRLAEAIARDFRK